LAPEELRRRQLAALTNWVMASAKVQPIVLAFEDLHWADPTTLDVLRGIAERGALAPLFILATTRPEFRPPWSMRSHHGTISLAPLDRGQVRDMVAELSARHALPTDVVEDVAARTGGVPLFVEEVTRLLLERGEGGGGIEAIPATLQQSLMARLDRLGPAREVAQIGAVIGRGFSYGLLRDVAGMEDAPLQAALEKLAEADIVLVQSLPPESDYRFKHSLIQDAAYENLLKSRRQVLHRRVAEILRDRFADTAAAEPEVLAHHFTQAGMTDAAIEWWGKAGDQALRRSAFQEAISHLGKAIEMADEAVEGAPRAAAGTTSASQRLRLQTGYGQALLWSKGFAADETKAAFTRAQELAAGIDNNSDERFATYYGQWLGSLFRGELALARKTAEIFLREAEKGSWITEALVARRILGLTCLHQGEFREAHAHLVQALRLYDPERDRDAKFRFGQDVGAAATAFLAHIHWEFGEVGQARELIEQALARAAESAHAPTLANTYHHKGVIEILRGDARAVWSATETMVGLGQQHQMGVYLAWGLLHTSWARARLGDCETRVTELRQALGVYTDQGNKLWMPFYQGLLAEIEAEGRGVEEALTRIDEALALAGATGEHWSDAFLHRIRGEILLKRDPADTAPAEEAFLTAIAVAQQQKARSFELRAALSLAKLYQGTNRAAEAYGVLAPALEGFSPTPEFPEIAEAQALLAKLADNEDVKNATTRRQRQVKLHTSYGQAMMWAKGFGSEESKAAFLRVRELIGGLDNPTERASAYYGAWLSSFTRAEIPQAQDTAEAFLKDVSERLGSPEAGLAHRNYGMTRWFQGDFVGAREHAEQALTIYDRDRDRELVFKFGLDYGISATAFLALVLWALGEVDDARRISEEAVLQAPQTEHVQTLFFVRQVTAYLEIIRGDSGRATPHLQACFDLALEHGMQLPLLAATYGLAWARWRAGLEKAEAQAAQMRDVRAQIREGHYILFDPLYAKLLADVELGAGRAESALDVVNEAISESEQTGQIWFDSELHRTRGDLLLKCGRPETAGGEAAFKAAIDIARRQQTRAFELRAVLSLAKLYQSSGRAANAHAVLGPALKDFSPTPEFPEIAEAQTLLTALQS
jgi:predicted ATPase